MDDRVHAITWEALEHNHTEKGADWFWAVGIIAISIAVAVFFFGNFLFAILVLVAAVSLSLVGLRKPKMVTYEITNRGVRTEDTLHPYASLESYHIDTESPNSPQLLLKSRKMFMPLIVFPLPEEYIDEVDEMLRTRIEEEELDEPFFNVILEFFGF